MVNKFFELEKLRSSLLARGMDRGTVDQIVDKADIEIEMAMKTLMSDAIEQAIAAGVSKGSSDFINDLRPQPGAFLLETASGNTDFSVPPFPMLPRLLQGAKPMKDGSGVYKVIPIGKPGNKKPVSNNIFDADRAIYAQRLEAAKTQYNKVAPLGSSTQFRTATSKQSIHDNWVMPAKEKDFTDDMANINRSLDDSAKSVISGIIREYEENF